MKNNEWQINELKTTNGTAGVNKVTFQVLTVFTINNGSFEM